VLLVWLLSCFRVPRLRAGAPVVAVAQLVESRIVIPVVVGSRYKCFYNGLNLH